MPEVIQSIRGITSGFGKTNRNTFLNHSSSAPSTSTVLLLTVTANCISKTITVLPHFGKADSHGKKRVVMVGKQSAMADWAYKHRHRSLFRQMHPKKAGGAVYRGIRTGGQ